MKGIIYKYFTYSNSKKYFDVLDGMTFLYNNRVHTSIGMSPNDVNECNVLKVWEYMQKKRTPPKQNINTLKVGDVVRVSNPKIS